MIDWITKVIGEGNTYEVFSFIYTFITYLIGTLLYMVNRKHRRLFFVRLIGSIIVGLTASFGFSLLNNIAIGTAFAIPTRIFCYFNVSSIIFAILIFCYDEYVGEICMLWCSGICTQHIANKIYPFIQNCLGINDTDTCSLIHPQTGDLQDWEFLLYLAIIVGLMVLISLIFKKKNSLYDDKITRKKVVIFTVSFTIIINTIVCVSRLFEKESMALSMILKMFTTVFCVLIMFLISGVFESNKQSQDYFVIKELLHREKDQFENVKTNMEAINIKVHDLKKIINKVEDKMNEQDIEDLKKALDFYDSTIKTGNDVLDVVLSEKSLICRQNNIKFTCMANGEKLSFFTPNQIYSLFGNIMDNAIRASKDLSEEKRFISLTIKEEDKHLIIEESNFYVGKINVINDSYIETSKEEKSKHGYGIKSITYLVEKYGGSAELIAKKHRFQIKIRIPL